MTGRTIWFSLVLLPPFAQGQDLIHTIAGGGPDPRVPALSVSAGQPAGVAVDARGNYFVSAFGLNRIFKADRFGQVTPIAGNGAAGYAGENVSARESSISGPTGLTVDADGNVYFVESGTYRVRRIDKATGRMTTVAGSGPAPGTPGFGGFGGDGGPATAAQFNFSSVGSAALDGAGNLIITDTGNHRIRRVDRATGIITTIAGNGQFGFGGDGGPAVNASLAAPANAVADAGGNIYIADSTNARVRRVTPAGIITTIAGNGQLGVCDVSGPATTVPLPPPRAVALDSAGRLYIADFICGMVRVIENGVLRNIGPLNVTPDGLALRPDGGIVLFHRTLSQVWELPPGSTAARQILGNGTSGSCGEIGPATSACLWSPAGIEWSGFSLYIADRLNNQIRVLNGGFLATFAGGRNQPQFPRHCGDGGPAFLACFANPEDLAAGSSGMVVADTGNHVVRRIDQSLTITTLAGTPMQAGYTGSGVPANTARLRNPTGVAFDPVGNLYIADSGNHVIRQVRNGIITTVAGSGAPGYNGDGVPATQANLTNPQKVKWHDGKLYIADTGASRVRVVDLATNIITTLLGPRDVTFVTSLLLDPGGNLYIGEPGRVRRWDPVTRRLLPVAGTGAQGYSGDGGPAASAQISTPMGMTLDPFGGGLVFADSLNNRIRLAGTRQGCVYELARTSASLAGAGDFFRVEVTTAPVCPWTAATESEWLALDTSPTASGAGSARFVAAPNLTGAPRTGQVRVAGRAVTVIQTAGACRYVVSRVDGSPAESLPATGGTLRIAVATGATCQWTAVAAGFTSAGSSTLNGGWMTIQSGASGVGNGMVEVSVAPNTHGCDNIEIPCTPRAGIVTVGGQSIQALQRHPDQPPTPHPYSDAMTLLGLHYVTSGCTGSQCEPERPITRAALASLIVKAPHGLRSITIQTPPTPYFEDVPPQHPQFLFIQKLRELGVTLGCTATRFCPDGTVTRAEAAAMLARARLGVTAFETIPADPAPHFEDVRGAHPFFHYVQRMKQDGISVGCTPVRYCPDELVTNGSAAALVVRAFFTQ